MKTRVITATVMFAIMIPFLIFSSYPVFPLLFSFFGVMGVYELLSCVGEKKNLALMLPYTAVSAAMPFIARYAGANMIDYVFIIAFAVITYGFAASVFSKGKLGADIAAIASALTVYISFGFSSVVLLRDGENGEFVYFLAFIIPWMTDIFAYFCGRAFGKHKLIPEVSPKKTVEGSVGGTLFAVLITLLYGFIVGRFTDIKPNYIGLAAVAAVVSLLSQCGDLIMSLIKRKFGIKDYGKIFPGHGGVLDRFDSIVCTAPFIFFLTEYVPMLQLFEGAVK